MEKRRTIVLLALLLAILIICSNTVFRIHIARMVAEEDVLDSMQNMVLDKYKYVYMNWDTEELYNMLSYDYGGGTGSGYLDVSVGNVPEMSAHWWKGRSGSRILSEDEFDGFTRYIKENSVNFYGDYYNDNAKGSTEYVYLHLSKDGVNRFRFHEPDTENGKKYADLLDIFAKLTEGLEQDD